MKKSDPSVEDLKRLLNLFNKGKYNDSEKLALSITKEFPNHQFAWKVLGATLEKKNNDFESLCAKKMAVKLAPSDIEALSNLANILYKLKKYKDAEINIKKAIKLNPNFSIAYCNLGNILQKTNRFKEAEDSYLKAISLNTELTEAYYNLGRNLEKMSRYLDALINYKKAIKLNPNFAECYNNIGNVFQKLNQYKDAKNSYQKAIDLKPQTAEFFNNQGSVMRLLKKYDQAKKNFKKAIKLRPSFEEAYNNLAITFHDLGEFDEAEKSFRKSIELNKNYAPAYNSFGYFLYDTWRLNEAELNLKKAIKLKPNHFPYYSNLLFLKSISSLNNTQYFNEAIEFGRILNKDISFKFSEWSYKKNPKKLRIGFISPDFKNHPIGFFLEGLLENIDRTSIELFAYSIGLKDDGFTKKLKPLFDNWRSLNQNNDNDVAKTIHEDQIHILIDLAGHTVNNRMPILSMKPSPIQITWLGYWATSGLKEMDYIFGDPYITPINDTEKFTEKIWRLPHSIFCLKEPEYNLKITPLPAVSNGFITFGCFNNITKMNNEVVEVRSKILNSIPDSKLFLKDKKLSNELWRKEVLKKYSDLGINENRIILEGSSKREEYLSSYNQVDIALSPFPYGGGTTTIEGLWMGVPAIVKKGNSFISRIGETIFYNTDFQDWIAKDNKDYISKAINFSSNLDYLHKIRKNMRKNLTTKPIFDIKNFTINFENSLWSIWKKYEKS